MRLGAATAAARKYVPVRFTTGANLVRRTSHATRGIELRCGVLPSAVSLYER